MGPDRPGSTTVDPDRLAALEEERSFLLRSLRDLDAEHVAGDVDEHDYTTLRDGYTKRAADVMREIEDGRARLPARRPTNWPRRIGVGVAVVAAAVGAGFLVARSSGDEITGDAPGGGVAAMLAEARIVAANDPLAALELYDDVLEVQPDHAEALTYSGWLLVLVGQESADEALVVEFTDRARQRLAEAVEADPSYADPHCYLGIIAAGFDGDVETARSEAETCLDLDPPADLRAETESYLAQLD